MFIFAEKAHGATQMAFPSSTAKAVPLPLNGKADLGHFMQTRKPIVCTNRVLLIRHLTVPPSPLGKADLGHFVQMIKTVICTNRILLIHR